MLRIAVSTPQAGRWAPACLSALFAVTAFSVTAFSVTGPAAAAQVRDGWFGAEKAGARSLNYGVVPPRGEPANAETIYLRLSCSKDGRFLDAFVAETGATLKPGRQVRVTLSVKAVKTSVAGRTLANQLAGVPSLQFRIPIGAPVLAAMKPPAVLVLSAGGWRATKPLHGIGNQLNTVIRSCRAIGRKAARTPPEAQGKQT